VVKVLLRARLSQAVLGKRGPEGLEKGHVVSDPQSLLMRHRQREGQGQLPYGLDKAILAVFLPEDVFERGPQDRQPLRGRAGDPHRPVEARHDAGRRRDGP